MEVEHTREKVEHKEGKDTNQDSKQEHNHEHNQEPKKRI